MRNVSEKVVENIKTRILWENRAVYAIISNSKADPYRPQMKKR
jgi:hypothetical protein